MAKIEFDEGGKKKGGFKKILKIFLVLIIIGGLIGGFVYLIQNGIITKEHGGKAFELYSRISSEYGKYLLLVIIVMGGIILFMSYKIAKFPFKMAALQANLRLKEKEVDKKFEKFRADYNEKSFKFSTLILKVSDLISSLEKDRIFNTMLSSLEKGCDADKISLWILNHKNGDLIPVKTLGIDIAELKMFHVNTEDENFVGAAAKNIGFYSKQEAEENVHAKGLIDKAPFDSVIAFPLICQDKVFGVVNIGTFKKEKYAFGDSDEEEIPVSEEIPVYSEYTKDDKILMTTLARLCGLALMNSNVLEMTEEELVSEKKFSAKQLEEKKNIREMFSKYSAPAVVDQLLQNPGMLKLGGDSKFLTVFFSDIRGFTTYSEKYPPAKVVEVLNEYLSEMTKIVMEYKGTLDKFIGDAVMAIWGAPVPQEDHARLAVKASWKMLEVLKMLESKWKAKGVEPFRIGIGLNSGDMIVGNIGSDQRMDYTVIGDAVNACSRIEGLTRRFTTDLIISESTYELVKDIVEVKKLGAVQVKGKDQNVVIYQVNDVKDYNII